MVQIHYLSFFTVESVFPQLPLLPVSLTTVETHPESSINEHMQDYISQSKANNIQVQFSYLDYIHIKFHISLYL